MQFLRIRKTLIPGESGISLLETLVALAVLGTIAVTFLNGMVISTKAAFTTDKQATAESLARSQVEWIQDTAYTANTSQYSIASIPEGKDYVYYSANIIVESLNNPDDGIQKITAIVYYQNEEIVKLEGYKVDR